LYVYIGPPGVESILLSPIHAFPHDTHHDTVLGGVAEAGMMGGAGGEDACRGTREAELRRGSLILRPKVAARPRRQRVNASTLESGGEPT
jgi:hypothetical protein